METIRYSPIGKEDIAFGVGSFEVTLADGRVVMLSQVDVGAILNAGLATGLTGLTLTNTTLAGTAIFNPATIDGLTLTTTTLTSPIINTGTVGADPSADLGIASKQYVDHAFDNPIINPNMELWQRGTTFAAAATATYSADRWRWGQSGAGVVTLNRTTTVPSVASAGVLFNYALEVDVTSADASIAASDFYIVSQRIEGFNWRHFAQRQFTLSFWVSSTKTGIHCVAFRNNAAGTPDRCYIAEYTINATDTFEYKTITVSASPSGGTWDYTTGVGLEVAFVLAGGSTFQTTANAWQTGNFYATSNQVDAVDSSSNFFRVTGIRLDLGATAHPIEFRSIEQELRLCQRYYEKSFALTTTPIDNLGTPNTGATGFVATRAGANTQVSMVVSFQTRKRINPTTYTFYNPGASGTEVRDVTAGASMSSTTLMAQGETGFATTSTGNAGTAIGDALQLHWTASAEL